MPETKRLKKTDYGVCFEGDVHLEAVTRASGSPFSVNHTGRQQGGLGLPGLFR